MDQYKSPPPPLAEGGRGMRCILVARETSCLEVPRLRMGVARRAAVLRIAHAGGDIAQLVRHQAHAKPRRRLPDGTDAVLLIDQDLPDFLRVAIAALGLETRRLGVQIEYFQDVRIVRLGALLAARRVPVRIGRAKPGIGYDGDGP